MTSACSTFVVSGSILVTNAASVVRSGSTAIASGVVEIDLSAVTEADSSSLAVVLQWMREANERRQSLALVSVPESMRSLAAVYGVEQIIPQ